MLIRRVVPAIVATLAVYAGLAVAAGLYLRQHYLTPLLIKNNPPGSAWIIGQQWYTKGGQPVSQSVLSQVLQGAPQLAGGKGGRDPAVRPTVPVPQPARVHAVDQLPAGQPVLAVPVDRGRLAARAVGAAHRRDRLAGPPPRRLSRRAISGLL